MLLLAPVTDPAAIPHALASALNLQVVQGDVLAACAAFLGDRSGLLVVDNCEHLLDAARDAVGVLLSACPRLTVLATSREPLGLPAEYTFRLATARTSRARRGGPGAGPSVAVFLDRARRVRPGPPPTPAELRLVADIVRRLDGLPLAIELAAGRLSGLSLVDLHRRLDRALDLLGGRTGGGARHRTLRATVEWSYQLLDEDERRLFRYLSVFVDGIALDDAERLATDLGLAGDPGTVLSRLVDTSMVDAEFAERRHPRTGCWRRCGRSGSTGSPPRARTATGRTACSGGRSISPPGSRDGPRPSASPRRTRSCAASWRTCGRRGSWPAGGRTSTRPPR